MRMPLANTREVDGPEPTHVDASEAITLVSGKQRIPPVPIALALPSEDDGDEDNRITLLPSDLLEEVRDSIVPPPASLAEGRSILGLTPMWTVLLAARRRRPTGTLVLEVRGERHAVVFEQGTPVDAQAHVHAPPLGWVVRQLGWIGPERLRVALSRASVRGSLLGAQLVADGLLSRARLAEALSFQLAARIGALSTLPKDTQLEFYPRHDLLRGRAERPIAPCPAEVALLAVTRRMNHERSRAILDRLGDGRIDVHASVATCMRPTPEEWRVLSTLEKLQVGPRGLFAADVVQHPTATPLLVALTLLKEAHPRGQPCALCARRPDAVITP
jgi:hypothetical protein